MRYCVKRVCDGDDPRRERDRFFLQTARVAGSVPALVVRHDTFRKVGIKRRKRSEYLRTALRMRTNLSSFVRIQLPVVVNHVEERLVNLADVVEQCDAFDHVTGMSVGAHRVCQNERIPRDPPDMRASNRVVGVDGVEQGLHRSGAQPLELAGGRALTPGCKGRRSQSSSNRDGACYGRGRAFAGVFHLCLSYRKNRVLCAMAASERHAIATVSSRGAHRWDSGHPWIFRSDIVKQPDSAAGSVEVEDQRGRPLGVALWSPKSEISLRLLTREADVAIDRDWWKARIGAAAARRTALAPLTNAWRVVHGEGDGLPSLVIDRYGDYIVLQLSSAGIEAFRDEIVGALIDLFRPAGILARNDAGSREREGLVRETVLLHGEVPEEIEVSEYGIRYLAAPWTGQKTGAFLDQRENRHMIGELARGAALDCFSYHGSFALHLARRASHVTSLDSSAAALDRALQNAQRNNLSNIDFVTADAFDFLHERERDGTRYDTIVLDPPAFAKNKPSLPGAIRGYKDINLRAMKLLAPGGLLFTASCSFHLTRPLFLDILRDAASDSGRRIVLRELTGQAIDHPEIVTIPETGYLKGALLEAAD